MNLVRIFNILSDHTLLRKGSPIRIIDLLKANKDTFNSQNYKTKEEQKKQLLKIFEEAKANAKSDGVDENGLRELSTLLDELLLLTGTVSHPLVFPEYEGKNIAPKPSISNILFLFGNPNTGKSYGFQPSNLGLTLGTKFYYEKITVSGGIGNEFRGLQSSDLAISMDVINRSIKLGPLLITLMRAVLNPTVPHVIVLDDAHNQNLSSLLSEFTPVFKEGEKVVAYSKDKKHDLVEALGKNFKTSDVVNISQFNDVIRSVRDYFEKNGIKCGNSKITNRVSGEDIEIIFPDNFFLLVAGNYNQHTTNIFADWRDRAVVKSIHSLSSDLIERPNYKNDPKKVSFNRINQALKEVLSLHNIFDFDRYLFGIFKVEGQSDDFLIKFAFAMIKNSLVEHGNSHKVNLIGKDLIAKLQGLDENPLVIKQVENGLYSVEFSKSIEGILLSKEKSVQVQNQILHALNLYQQED